jgi:hypothetical protein
MDMTDTSEDIDSQLLMDMTDKSEDIDSQLLMDMTDKSKDIDSQLLIVSTFKYLTLFSSLGGIPLNLANSLRCSLPVNSSYKASNCGQYPIFCCTCNSSFRILSKIYYIEIMK